MLKAITMDAMMCWYVRKLKVLYYRAYQYIKQNGELKKVNEWSEIKYLWMEGGNEKVNNLFTLNRANTNKRLQIFFSNF